MSLAGCVVHCSLTWQRCALDSLVTMLGATFSVTLDDRCTHVLTARAGSHRHHVAKVVYPNVHVLHPKWLWACFWSRERVNEDKYDIDFFTDTLRCGTSTVFGTRELFKLELPLFRLAERRVRSTNGFKDNLKDLLHNDDFDTTSPHWSFVSQVLQGTLFWGTFVRSRNWKRRRVLVMCLLRNYHRPQKERKLCQNPAVLQRVADLPYDAWRQVVTFL